MRESGRTKAMLCEMIIVALFLALSSITLLRLFAASDSVSRESQVITCATLLAQDALEQLTAGQDLPAAQVHTLDGQEYTVAVGVETDATPAGTLYIYSVAIQCGGHTVTQMQSAAYRPGEVAP